MNSLQKKKSFIKHCTSFYHCSQTCLESPTSLSACGFTDEKCKLVPVA